MGTPQELVDDGRSWRMMTYYALAMGGAAVNGLDAGMLSTTSVAHFNIRPIVPKANLSISAVKSTKIPNSVDLTVDITAIADFPDNTVLHIIAKETYADWAVYGYPNGTSNGQTYMTDIVIDMVTDTLGEPIRALLAGNTESLTRTLVTNTDFVNLDSVRIVAFLQIDDESHSIIGLTQLTGSPYDGTAIYKNKYSNMVSKQLNIKSFGKVIEFILPFNAAKATLFTLSGCQVGSYDLSSKAKGSKTSIEVPKMQGFYLLSLNNNRGANISTKLIIK